MFAATASVCRTRRRVPAASDVARLRGSADALALLLRYHDAALHKKRSPMGQPARAVFDAVEQVRVQALGARRLSGVADNLRALVDHTCRAKGYAKVEGRDEALLADALALLVRERLTGVRTPALAAPLVDPWRPMLAEQCGAPLKRMAESMGDQAAFAEAAAQMIHALGLIEDDDPSLDQDNDEQNDDGSQEQESEEKTRAQSSDSGSDGG